MAQIANGESLATTRTKINEVIDKIEGNDTIDNSITISGDLTVDTNTLFVDSADNRVGIGTTDPQALLDVNGDAEINGLTVGRGAGGISNNSAVGYTALQSNTEGDNNVAVGHRALLLNTTGNNNIAVGYTALQSNTTGFNNTAIGFQALQSNTTGFANTAVGFNALQLNTTGVNNTAIGYQALTNNTTASNNTALGFRALQFNTTGANNTAFGFQAGNVITTGSRNTIFGQSCDTSAADGVDQIVVGYNLTGKGNETAFIGGTNGAYNEKNVTTWETTSDQRIKKNIVDNTDGLDVISQIQVRNFEYRAPDEITELPGHAAIKQEGTQIGVIAQELQQVLPECVSENSTGVLSVNTDPLVWYLINAVKELKAEIEELKGN